MLYRGRRNLRAGVQTRSGDEATPASESRMSAIHPHPSLEFFTRRGYVRTARDSAPPAIKTTREFAGICPASSAFMSKPL
jgi:hypothetical protein